MSAVTQLYFQFVEENNYMFRPLSGWAIIRLRPELRGNLICITLIMAHPEKGRNM
jgi:hypothetical protein